MRRNFALAGWLCWTLLLSAASVHAERDVAGQTASGAFYSIRVPDGWKSGDTLVLFQHGFSFDPPAPNPDLGPLADLQVSEGYAIAASSFSQSGWALFDAANDNAQLLDAFTQQIGTPGAIIPEGGSMGGLIALKLAEDARFAPTPAVFSACPPAAGSRAWDEAIDSRLAYDVVCKDINGGQLPTGAQPIPWAYNLDDIPDDLSDLQDAVQLAQTLVPVEVCTGVSLPSGLQNGAMARRLTQLEDFAHITDDDFFLIDMGYATYGLSDLVRAPDKLNGLNPFTTTGVVYADTQIDAGIARIDPDPYAALYFRWSTDFRGLIGASTKIVSIHTSEDQLVIPANQSVLRQLVPSNQLTSAFVNETSPTHCGFNSAEEVAAWETLRTWLAAGTQPTVSDLQNACVGAMSTGSAGPCRYDASIVPPSFDSQVTPRPASTAAPVDARYSGEWFDPARSGEGIALEILPGNKAVAYFFTYPPAGVAGQQAWVYGVGDVIGNGIEFADVLRPLPDGSGGITQAHWGRIALTFSDCGNAGMRWDGPSDWGSMEVPLTRLTSLEGLSCASPSAVAPAQTSGEWYDPAHFGSGFVFEQIDAQHIVALYFGFDTTGNPLWTTGIAALTTDGSYNGELARPTGTQFGSAFDSGNITQTPIGNLSLRPGCASGPATWTASGSNPPLPSATYALQRFTQPLGLPACSP